MGHGRKRPKNTRIRLAKARPGKDGKVAFRCDLCLKGEETWTTHPYYISPVYHAETDMVLFPELFICTACHRAQGHTLRPARRVVQHEYPFVRALNMTTSRGSACTGPAPSAQAPDGTLS